MRDRVAAPPSVLIRGSVRAGQPLARAPRRGEHQSLAQCRMRLQCSRVCVSKVWRFVQEATNGTSGGDNAATGIACRGRPGHGQRRAAALRQITRLPASEPVATLAARCPRNRGFPGISRHRALPSRTRPSSPAPASSTTTASRGSTSSDVRARGRRGRPRGRGFTPDFYLPEQNLYVEITVMKQSLVTRKNPRPQAARALSRRERQAFYKRDIRAPRRAIQTRPRLLTTTRRVGGVPPPRGARRTRAPARR